MIFIGLSMLPERPFGSFHPGDKFNCYTHDNHGYRQTYKWTDSNGIIVSRNASTTLTVKEGLFNWTCTVTDERRRCVALSSSISGYIFGKLLLNLKNNYTVDI